MTYQVTTMSVTPPSAPMRAERLVLKLVFSDRRLSYKVLCYYFTQPTVKNQVQMLAFGRERS
jgi:hypothetical protein